jgi:hypothetical protein
MWTDQCPETRQRTLSAASGLESLRRRKKHQHAGPDFFKLFAGKALHGALRRIHYRHLTACHLGDDDEMKVARARHNMRDTREGDLGKMFGGAFHSFG